MKKSEQSALVQEAINDAQTKKFVNELGHHARVDRSSHQNETTEQLRLVLEDIGRDFLRTGEVPKGMEYLGSVATHIYVARSIGEVAYYHQLGLDRVPEPIAGPAVSDLRQTMIESFGHRRQKKRSGF